MNSIRKAIECFPGKVGLDGELMPGQLLVELFGFCRVLVENHCGVVKYEPQEICIKSKSGILHISGRNMILARMSKEQLVITGNIESVSLEKRGRP